MIRYRHDPDRPGEPIVEATPRDLDAYRGFARSYLHAKWPVLGEADVDEVMQDSLFVLWRMVDEGRVRGTYTDPPDVVIRSLLVTIAWRVAGNHAAGLRRRDARHDPIDEEHDLPDPSARPEDIAEARRILRTLVRSKARPMRVLLLVVQGESAEDIAAQLGIDLHTVYNATATARRQLAARYGRPRWSRKRTR
ncbi:sigma-70 family RNA polymerase sigma factor [Polyangium sp. y55x31]|uniref:RNA polymerase sigma factor n=1 Tax=Polyangium sp. y55x31 TaxID=3042688 RepID=UPI0024826563|nr:sigma-70 family RNA polymerase sigma factor [Polyangium sp. y55x31]MDI1481457.1 sigma-70 family RNA polymerase sigma factor [Polyangium sp. y55x31]